jgi:hypothetical protein
MQREARDRKRGQLAMQIPEATGKASYPYTPPRQPNGMGPRPQCLEPTAKARVADLLASRCSQG